MRIRAFSTLLGALSLAGCGSDPAPDPVDDLLAPPPAGAGVQYGMRSRIEAGQEIERCQLVVAPEEGLFIKRDEVRFTAGSHHVLLYATPYTEIPSEDRHGVAVDGSRVHDCASGAVDAWEVTGILAGSQSSDENSIVGELPDGVAIRVEPGAVLLIDTHYLNASAEAVEADARINLYTVPAEQAKTEAGVLFLYDPFIRVPANGAASARMRCPVQKDISITRAQSHMHRRGTGFVADVTDGSGAKLQEIYAGTAWEQVPARDYRPLLHVAAGQAIDFRCDYQNTEPHPVMQGLSTRDEMCLFIGPYFPRDRDLEVCNTAAHEPGATWIGSGGATCAETLACISSAKPTDDDHGDALYGCVVESCPGAAGQVSEVMRCQMTAGHGACAEACSGSGDCGACMSAACGAAISACMSATCD